MLEKGNLQLGDVPSAPDQWYTPCCCPASRWQKKLLELPEQVELWAAQPCRHSPVSRDVVGLKFRATCALFQFDLVVYLTFFFVAHSVAGFCISCSQTADDLLFLHHHSWLRQPASLGVEEECWCVFVGNIQLPRGEQRGRALCMCSWEVKLNLVCSDAPCNRVVSLQRVLKQNKYKRKQPGIRSNKTGLCFHLYPHSS